MAKLFNWQVAYVWKNKKVVVGKASDEKRTIHIVDLSEGKLQDSPSGFVLIVSRANNRRWHDIAQQESWTGEKGNYCFIDPATEGEVESIAAKCRGEAGATTALQAFRFVGGVPRLCVEAPQGAKELVDNDISVYGIRQLVYKLSLLDDTPQPDVGEKVQPGLVGHFVPTNRFRNYFKIHISSPHVARALLAKAECDSDEKLQNLMQDLLAMPKARSFSGWIWEHLFTKKMSGESARITIVGSALPVDTTEPSVNVLLQKSASDVDFFEFKDTNNFLEKAKERAGNGDADFCAFAKATSDTFAAIDAVILIKEGAKFIVACLQLTVAEKYHPVLQSMILEFVNVCGAISDKAQPELWFLQPKQCLPHFGFVKLQAMEFDQITYPLAAPASVVNDSTATPNTKKSRRKRSRTEFFGDWVPSKASKGKCSSNDKTYWDQAVRSVPQVIGVVHIDDNSTVAEEQNALSSAFLDALKKATDEDGSASISGAIEPRFRRWNATTDVMEALDGRVHDSFMVAIQRDIAADRQALEDVGFVFDPPTPASAGRLEHDNSKTPVAKDASWYTYDEGLL